MMYFADLFLLHCKWQYINNLIEENVLLPRMFSAISEAISQICKATTKFKNFEKSDKTLLEEF